jgi:divalent metal cation (Fe/Co/Zn/Cd) transporter
VNAEAHHDHDHERISRTRAPAAIEDDIIVAVKEIPEIISVAHVNCHYLNEKSVAEVNINVDEELTIHQAREVAKKAKQQIKMFVPDLSDVEIHLELSDEQFHQPKL